MKFLRRFVFEFQVSMRFDQPLFVWDCTFHEKTLYQHELALWWPRFFVRFLGLSIGIAMWISKGVKP